MSAALLGRQEPTFLWVPPYTSTLGPEVIELAASAGLILDPWQRLCIMHAFAEDAQGSWLCFEVAIIVSRQNGKGSILEAIELAWLFLFGERLIIHSAHLAETAREHFLRMEALVTNHDAFRRRVKSIGRGRGSEAITLVGGQRLKFMSRKGGAGRGFTANKVVYDEAMFLDAVAMAAGLPTMATVRNPQVWYTGSAGMRHSTQLSLVRDRGYAQDDPALMFAEWAIDERPVEEGGDDRSLPETHAKANPGYGIPPFGRITPDYVVKEATALGGYQSQAFGQERLGVGDWPVDDQAWDVIDAQVWLEASLPEAVIRKGMPVAYGIASDPVRKVTTLACAAQPPTGAAIVQIVARHRGFAWVAQTLRELAPRFPTLAVVVLKGDAAAAVIDDLGQGKKSVQSPTDIEYAQACGRFKKRIEEGTAVHVAQPSLYRAVAGARKVEGREGGWRFSMSSPVDIGPVKAVALALRGLEHPAHIAFKPWAMSIGDLETRPAPRAANRGAAAFAAAKAGRP